MFFESKDKLLICDIFGNLMLEKTVDEYVRDEQSIRVDLSSLNNGIYLVSIEGKAKPTKLIVSK